MQAQNSHTISRSRLGQEVTQRLRDMIRRGEFGPRQRLVEVELARHLGTSRTPVREGLLRLEQDGLLQRRPQGGFQVRPISRAEVEEVVGLRALLESHAAQLAARRMNSTTLARLRRNLAAFERALARGDKRGLVRLNTEFHEVLYRAAQSPLLLRLTNDLQDMVHRFRRALLRDTAAAGRSLAAHRDLMAALEAGDSRRAGSLCRKHIRDGGRWITAALRQGDLEL